MADFIYCPQCRNKLIKLGRNTHCNHCNITYYKNSKPTAGALPVKDDQVLLAKRGIEPFKGEYDIIGGFLHDGEHPEDGAKREAEEETGQKVEIIDLIGIYIDKYGKNGKYTLSMIYVAKMLDDKIKAQEDVASLHWIPIGKVPKNHGFQNTKQALIDLKKWYIKNNEKFR